MTKSIASHFNLFDYVGYLIVGSTALLLVAFDLWALNEDHILPSIDLNNILVWLIVAYFAGHLTQAIASIIVGDRERVFTEANKQVLAEAREFFGISEMTEKEVYRQCYMLACSKDLTGHVNAFNAHYGLYRGWFILLLGEAVFCVACLIFVRLHWVPLVLAAGFIVAALLVNHRRKRFWNYLTEKTLQTFVVLRRIES